MLILNLCGNNIRHTAYHFRLLQTTKGEVKIYTYNNIKIICLPQPQSPQLQCCMKTPL